MSKEDIVECNQIEIAKTCTCTYPCSKKGKCCECISYHRNMGELPGCLFPPEAERTYDRSRRAFAKAWGLIE